MTGLLGAGTYFASRSAYSDDYSSRAAHSAEDMQRPAPYVPPWAGGGKRGGKGRAAAVQAALAAQAHGAVGSERQMLLVRVVEGRAGQGVPGQRRPSPGFHSATAPDAAAGGVQQRLHRLLCIFDHTQAYPE